MPFYSLDDFINDRMSGFSSIDYFTQQRKPFLSLDEFTAERMGIDYKKFKDLQKYKQVEEDHRGIGHILEQFGRGLAKEATFGFAPKLIGEEEPVGMGEQIARGAGSFVGFLAPLGLAGKAVKYGGKALGLTTGLIKASPYAKELVIAGRVGRTAVNLGLASAISDIPATIEDPMSAVKRAKEGAVLGAIFGGAGMAHIESHKALSWMLRQTGGRAAMLAAGMYGPETLDKENLAQTVFSEALNTLFLSHGVTPKMILEGKFNTPSQKALYEMLDADTIHMNEHTMSLSKLKVPFEMFAKPKTSVLNLLDIMPSIDIDTIKGARVQIDQFKGMMKHGKVKRPPLRVQWSNDKAKYEAIDQDNEYLVALQERYHEKGIEREERSPELRVSIVKDSSGIKPKTLPRPIENAMRFYAPGVYNEDFTHMLHTTRYWKYDVDKRQLSPTPQSQQMFPAKIKLEARDILLERSELDKPHATWRLTPIAKGKSVPTFEWDARKVFSRHVDDQLYKTIEGEIDQFERAYPGLKTGDTTNVPPETSVAYDNAKLNLFNMHKHNVALEEPINQQILRDMESGKISKKWKGIDKIIDNAERRLKLIYNIQDMKLPLGYLDLMKERVENLKIGATLESLQESLEIKGKFPAFKMKDLLVMQEKLFELESLPVEDRISGLTSYIAMNHGLEHPELTGEARIKQDAIEALERNRRKNVLAKAVYNAEHVPGSGSVMKQLLTFDRLSTWLDFNKFAALMQAKTGIPMHDLYRKIHAMTGEKKKMLIKHTKFLNAYNGMPETEQAGVFLYYRRLYALESIRDIPLNERQLNYIKDVNTVMKELAPLVVEERFKMWNETVAEPELEITGNPVHPAAKAFPRQNEPEIRSFLFRGRDAWIKSIMKQDRSFFDMWIQEAIDRQIGTVSKDVYLPEFIVNMGKTNLMYEYEASNIGFVGKGHLKSRAIIKDRFTDLDLVESLADEFRDKNLHVRLHAYINQILNVKYIEPSLDGLESIINTFGNAFKEAKPPGLGRKGVEAKGISMLDYFRLYAHRVKGYPIKIGPIGEHLRFIQSAFFRSLVVRPFLITRNLPQRIVTAPHKSNVLDPRYLFQKRFSFDAMPDDIKGKYLSTVSQLSVFRQDYLQLMESEKMKTWPFIGTFVKLAEKVGSLYSLSDEYNRRYVFSKTFFKAKDYINKYIGGQINQDLLDRTLGIGKMESVNQRTWRGLIQGKKVDEAAAHLAEWTDMNTNWMYGRTEKSLPEMTG